MSFIGVSSQQAHFYIKELKNVTTEVNLLAGNAVVEILACERSSITFQLSQAKAVTGQLISLKGVCQVKDENDILFTAIGRVSDIKSISDRDQEVTIRMNQYDVETWGRIIDLLGKRQKWIDNLLYAMKGED